MCELADDLKTKLQQIQQTKQQYDRIKNRYNEMSEIIRHLQSEKTKWNEFDEKNKHELETIRAICSTQQQTISNLSKFKEENDLLLCKNSEQEIIIKDLNKKQEETLKLLKSRSTIEVEKLRNELEAAQATSDLNMNEMQNEVCGITHKYEEQLQHLKEANQHLEVQLDMCKNQLNTNSTFYQNRILDLEQKIIQFENEKAIYSLTKGNFISAGNVYKATAPSAPKPNYQFNIRSSNDPKPISSTTTDGKKRFRIPTSNNNQIDTLSMNSPPKPTKLTKRRKLFQPDVYDYLNQN